jgi:trk system potassium uptake protein TrkA
LCFFEKRAIVLLDKFERKIKSGDKMKIIIAGCGKVGATLAEQLIQEKHEVTIIDKNASTLQSTVTSLDVMGVVGNAASYHVQMEAGIEEADLLIAVTSSDELNMLCCLIAKKAGDCHTIARVRNPEYNEEINYIKEELGLSMTINPEMAAAVEISRLLRFPSAIKVDSFAKGRVELMKIRIPEGNILSGMKISDISIQLKCKVLVCVVERGEEVTIPSGNFVLQANDKISIIASPEKAIEFFKKINIVASRVKDTMIAGGGTIAFYLTKRLIRSGMKVKIIEKDRDRCELLSDLIPEAMIIHGDATDQQILLEEGIDRMGAFAALTDLDEENIMLSLYAGKRPGVKLITKVNRPTFEEVIKDMSIGSVIYPKYITAELIVRYVRAMQNSFGSNVETLYRIVENKAEALEFRVKENSKLIGVPLEKLDLKENLLVSCINRNGKIITPGGQDMINVGDTVIIVTTNRGLNDLSDILKYERN